MARKKRKPEQQSLKQNDQTDVTKTIKAAVTRNLHHSVRKYREQRETLTAYLERDPAAPTREKQANREQATEEIQRLADMWSEVMPYVRTIRPLLADILDQSRLTACYLLFCKISQGLEAIFVLARDGFHYEVMEIVRSNREALDLIALFLRQPEDSPLFKQWFDGEIIENVKARQTMEGYIKDTAEKSGMSLSISGMKSGIYGTLSKYSHVSYGALLESYDVYHQDFDFERIAGYHYVVKSSLPYVRTEAHGAIVALKDFYSSIKDYESYRGLDAILRKHAPHMYDEAARKARTAAIMARFKSQ